MPKQYKLIHPMKYFRDYVNTKIRPDGRSFDTNRPVGINSGAISSSNGSAAVKMGNTSVLCGIRAELAKPKVEKPVHGYLCLNVEFLPIYPSKCRAVHNLNDDSELLNSAISDVIKSSNCIDLKQLCISREKLVWALYLDVIVLENDGCTFDATLVACIVALKDLKVPTVKYDNEINKIDVDISKPYQVLKISSKPISSTLLLFGEYILMDPTAEEENLNNSLVTIAVSANEPCFALKLGGETITSELSDSCIGCAFRKETIVLNLFKEINM